MKNIKRLIILISILIIIISAILISIIRIKEVEEESKNTDNGYPEMIEDDYQTETSFVKISSEKRNKYFAVEDMANYYITALKEADGIIGGVKYNSEDVKNEGYNRVLDLLDEQCKREFNITKENISQKIDLYDNYDFNIEQIYMSEFSENKIGMNLFIVEATLNKEEFDLLIKLDGDNMTYSVFLGDFIKKYSYSVNMDKKDINIKDEYIQSNDNNKVTFNNITDEYLMKRYLSKYIYYLKNNIQRAYSMLDNDYMNNKFKDINVFSNYADININTLNNLKLTKYNINQYDNYTEYTCVDQYGNYYIFQEKGVMDFTVKLDTYTIDTEEFIERYNNSSNAQKTQMNLDKIFQALNRHDYEYIYNKLDNTFKSNNFLALLDFENYMKNTFYNANKVEYGDFSQQSETYIYETKITDNSEENENILEKIFMMKLGEGTDFTISFNI